ncbi:MAG: glycoside hydrolase family 5 protein [Clostridia bacterium]|nr:glycoside hydrolase family 5 protein [Clostridia bacterium]MDD4387442.1 glycoside hydrolase family 5 protein [Clostridia bacterium]
MKKEIILICIIIVLISIILFTGVIDSIYLNFNKENNNLVSKNGFLKVEGKDLTNKRGDTIQLKGLSSHGIQWYSDMINYKNLKHLRDEWGINVFRIALYTLEGGYIYKPNLKEKVIEIIDIAIELNLYVIVDWHILSDNNPNLYKEQAKDFFNEISLKYKNIPNVIYEICNEPNSGVSWDYDIKPYAEEIIPLIRNNSKKSLIIVGTQNWSQDVDIAADNPLDFNNIVYACHFYSGDHDEELRKKIDYALNKNISIFISEWGVSKPDGDGGIHIEESNEWINFLDERNISWINWSFSDKKESSAILSYYNNLEHYNIDDNLSPAGEYIKTIINTKKTNNKK